MYRVTNIINDIDTIKLVRAYEALTGSRVDTAVPQSFYDKHRNIIRRRGGAFWEYKKDCIFGQVLFYDEMMSRLGVSLDYEECRSD